jgi:hypothetical protein
MKNFTKVVCSCFIAGMFIMIALGCASQKTLTYDVCLTTVEAPADAKEQFGETKVVSFTDQASSLTKYSYEDDFISITWYVDSEQFNFTLKNKTQYTIKINWDDISYVNYNGYAQRMMHAGVKYTERNASQPSTMIPKGATISDLLQPTDNVYWVNSTRYTSGGWRSTPLIPNVYNNENPAAAVAANYVGKTMTILLPIYIEDVQNDYIFNFYINAYKVPKK